MARVKTQQEHICPNCNVRVLSEAAVVEVPGQDEPLCVICAPYDPEREPAPWVTGEEKPRL